MDRFIIFYLSALSILLPIFFGIWRRDRVAKAYVPLVILLVAGAVNEAISYCLICSKGTNLFNGNIYVLLEFILVGWLFKRLVPTGNLRLLNGIIVAVVIVWIADNLVIHTPFDNNSLFRMVGSLLIVGICLDRLNLLLFFNDPSPLKLSDVFLCGGLFLYHLYKAFIEAFHVFPIPVHRLFYQRLWLILCILNIIMHILFSLAILWLPKKQTSTSRS